MAKLTASRARSEKVLLKVLGGEEDTIVDSFVVGRSDR